MLVADLTHFQDVPEDAPGPAVHLAEHLGGIVRAATAGDAGVPWASALPCRRRPGRRVCSGRMVVHCPEPLATIRWQCSVCGDDGVINNWVDSHYDLRRRHLVVAGTVHEVVISDAIAAALRSLELLDPDGERLVFSLRAHPEGAAMTSSAEDLDELIGYVAAEANHEPNPRRQARLDAAFRVLRDALAELEG